MITVLVAVVALYAAFVTLTATGLAAADAAWVAMFVSGVAFWWLVGRLALAGGGKQAGTPAHRLARIGVVVLVTSLLLVGWICGGLDLVWRVGMLLAPVVILAAAILVGRGSDASDRSANR